jgi:chromosome segregation ATPase
MIKSFFIIALAFVILSSCSTTSTDPREGGFFGGLKGIYSGTYDNRIQEREAALEYSQSTQESLKNKSEDLNVEVQLKDKVLKAEREKAEKIESDLAAIEEDVFEIQSKSAEQKTEIKSLQTKIRNMRKQIDEQEKEILALDDSGGSPNDPQRYQRLLKERDRLNKEYELILDYSKALIEANN